MQCQHVHLVNEEFNITSTVFRSTKAFGVDFVLWFTCFVFCLCFLIFVIFLARIYPLIVEADFLLRLNICDGEDYEEGLLNVPFVDIAWI